MPNANRVHLVLVTLALVGLALGAVAPTVSALPSCDWGPGPIPDDCHVTVPPDEEAPGAPSVPEASLCAVA